MGIFSSRPKQPTYADILRARQAAGEELTADEMRTLAAIDGTNDQTIWNSDSRTKGTASIHTTGPHCPKCKSENIQLLGRDRKAFSVGKAVAGGVLTGGIGTLAGFAGKKGKYQWVCMNCSNRFEMK